MTRSPLTISQAIEKSCQRLADDIYWHMFDANLTVEDATARAATQSTLGPKSIDRAVEIVRERLARDFAK